MEVIEKLCKGLLPEKLIPAARSKILEREGEASTAIGKKVALPHASIDALDDFILGVAVSPHAPITGWETFDMEPLHIVVMILAPSGRRESYLEILSEISKKLGQRRVVDEILKARTREEVAKIFHS